MYICMYVSMHDNCAGNVCMYVYTYACMHVCMYAYMYVCMTSALEMEEGDGGMSVGRLQGMGGTGLLSRSIPYASSGLYT